MRRRMDISRQEPSESPAFLGLRPIVFAALALTVSLASIGAAGSMGLLLGSASGSVPPGLYFRTPPADATYVTFCLAERHRGADYYPHFCSPAQPDGIRILKRITRRHADGSLTLAGATPRALDSRFLGRIGQAEVRSWWRPLVQFNRWPE